MRGYETLLPKTDKPPARAKDPGVVNLVMSGEAAYNAKNGELVFLPEGERKRREVADALASCLFQQCGLQHVGCGSDEAVFSIAERYVRDWGQSATGFCYDAGRDARILAWNADQASAESKAERVMDAALGALRGMDIINGSVFSFAEEVTESSGRAFALASKCERGAERARGGFICASCGTLMLPDSPIGFAPPQPGDGEAEGLIEDIKTPGADTIAELCQQLGINARRTIKAMLYVADGDGHRNAVAAFVRGDRNVSMNKLSKWLKAERGLTGLRTADKAELRELVGEVAGYCGPVGLPLGVVVVCDNSVAGAKNAVAGANRPGYHKKNCCHPRDFGHHPITDIAQIAAGAQCRCGGAYEACEIRESGNLRVVDLAQTPLENIKTLSCRDKDGERVYPAVCFGALSTEGIMLAGNE
ncbi:MAG: hypothetical protein LBQ36_07470 [Synergistaceae bacterium]|jgi:prolyl-tRNA synthetase|nr:hypothetical protein [Synergistaceae bacterium]